MSPAAWRDLGDEPPEPIRGIQRSLFWNDYRQLGGRPGPAYERDYVPGEFWSEEDPEERAFARTTRVQVWFVDLFDEATPERGYIRTRKPLPRGVPVVSDAEDAVNWMFLTGPPEDDVG